MGLAVGVFIGVIPVIGLHLVFAAVAAYFLRCNLPAALLGVWVFNPITAGPIVVAELALGHWIAEHLPTTVVREELSAAGKAVMGAWDLALGSAVLAPAAGLAAYALVNLGYRWAGKVTQIPVVKGENGPPREAT